MDDKNTELYSFIMLYNNIFVYYFNFKVTLKLQLFSIIAGHPGAHYIQTAFLQKIQSQNRKVIIFVIMFIS